MYIVEIGTIFGLSKSLWSSEGYYSTSCLTKDPKMASIFDMDELKSTIEELNSQGKNIRVWEVIPDIDGEPFYTMLFTK